MDGPWESIPGRKKQERVCAMNSHTDLHCDGNRTPRPFSRKDQCVESASEEKSNSMPDWTSCIKSLLEKGRGVGFPFVRDAGATNRKTVSCLFFPGTESEFHIVFEVPSPIERGAPKTLDLSAESSQALPSSPTHSHLFFPSMNSTSEDTTLEFEGGGVHSLRGETKQPCRRGVWKFTIHPTPCKNLRQTRTCLTHSAAGFPLRFNFAWEIRGVGPTGA